MGDGDLGISIEKAAKLLLAELDTYPLQDPSEAIHQLALTCQNQLGGTIHQ